MRLVVAVLFLFLTHLANAADVLVLIDSKDAGPRVPTAAYIHPTWILWPAASDAAGTNRLMSIPTGIDWHAQPGDDLFDVDLRPVNAASLARRGYFEATRGKSLTPVTDRDGRVSLPTLQASLTQPNPVKPVSYGGPLPAGLLVVTVKGPRAWDDMADIARRAGGRVLVVELPQRDQPPWTRMWLKGQGWPENALPELPSTGIPGLLPAREVVSFLKDGGGVWLANDTYRWGGANRWLEHGHFTAPVFMVFVGVVAIYVAGLAVYCTIREERGRLAQVLLRLLILGPAILVLAGRLTSRGMITDWPMWLMGSGILLMAVAYGVNFLTARLLPQSHALLGEMIVGLITCLTVDPSWSIFGNALGAHFVTDCPEVFGSMAAYAVGCMAFLRTDRRFDVVLVAQFVGLALALRFLALPWFPGYGAAAGLIALGVLFPRSLFVICPIMVAGYVYEALPNGVTYAANDLYATFAASKALNLADHVALVSSPAFIGFALFVLIVWIAGDKFLAHQVRRALAFNRQPMAFAYGTAAFAVVGLVNPTHLYAALACAMAGVVAVLFDAVRAP